MIEARQLVAMTDLISKVLQQLSGSYNNILNNNLNNNLSNLTIIGGTLGSARRHYRFLWDECSSTFYDCQSSLDFHHYR